MRSIAAICVLLCLCTHAPASGDGVQTDPQGDASIRRTDLGNDAPLPMDFVPIDLLSVSMQGWDPASPTTDLYTGSIVSENADFVRLRVVVDGLVSPPGPIGLNGFVYNPYQFGDRPITGFIDINIDDEKETGGELMPIAESRYLANVARFGKSPSGSIAERIVQDGSDLDSNFYTEPQFERTGAEFTLVLCGCFEPTIRSQNGNMDSIFDEAETWIVEGRFFERFESFQPESVLFGGTDFGLFNPVTTLQFVHDPIEDETSITLVFPITNAGAALIMGEPEQPIDFNITNHTSIEEALDDLIFGADFTSGPLRVLTKDWRDREFDDYRDPSKWELTALIGTAPLTKQPASFYIWTDTGFDERYADFNLDGINDEFDDDVLIDYIDDNDGTSVDDDGTVDGSITIKSFGSEFHFYDLNYDGIVAQDDLPMPVCVPDLTGDGDLDFFDISAFLTAFTSQSPESDLNADGMYDFFDVSAFLTLFNAGCP